MSAWSFVKNNVSIPKYPFTATNSPAYLSGNAISSIIDATLGDQLASAESSALLTVDIIVSNRQRVRCFDTKIA